MEKTPVSGGEDDAPSYCGSSSAPLHATPGDFTSVNVRICGGDRRSVSGLLRAAVGRGGRRVHERRNRCCAPVHDE
ncbi:unnamed protein product [Ectocarpus sp. CCAP 1310/34]|nr:unnamed protein product [Ectocarpus sp. CCAP 1310/34]